MSKVCWKNFSKYTSEAICFLCFSNLFHGIVKARSSVWSKGWIVNSTSISSMAEFRCCERFQDQRCSQTLKEKVLAQNSGVMKGCLWMLNVVDLFQIGDLEGLVVGLEQLGLVVNWLARSVRGEKKWSLEEFEEPRVQDERCSTYWHLMNVTTEMIGIIGIVTEIETETGKGTGRETMVEIGRGIEPVIMVENMRRKVIGKGKGTETGIMKSGMTTEGILMTMTMIVLVLKMKETAVQEIDIMVVQKRKIIVGDLISLNMDMGIQKLSTIVDTTMSTVIGDSMTSKKARVIMTVAG